MDDAIANGSGRFFEAFTGDVAVFHGGDFNVQIDAIEQRAGDALTITLHLHGPAPAFALEIAEVTARTGIHCGHKHKLGGKRDTSRGARHSDLPVLERLTHHFQCRSLELRKFIQKKHTVVGDTYFARIWKRSAAKQTDVANGVMRRAERSRRHKGLFGVEQPGDAVNLGRLDRFSERKRWDDCWDAFRQHRFPRARRTDHEDIVTACDGYLDGALDVALAFYIAEIDVVTLVRGEKFAQISARGQKRDFAAQKGERLPQILHAVYVDIVDHRGFERIGFGHEQRSFAAASRLERDRQHAFYGPNGTVQCQFADKTKTLERGTIEFLGHCDHSKRNR